MQTLWRISCRRALFIRCFSYMLMQETFKQCMHRKLYRLLGNGRHYYKHWFKVLPCACLAWTVYIQLLQRFYKVCRQCGIKLVLDCICMTVILLVNLVSRARLDSFLFLDSFFPPPPRKRVWPARLWSHGRRNQFGCSDPVLAGPDFLSGGRGWSWSSIDCACSCTWASQLAADIADVAPNQRPQNFRFPKRKFGKRALFPLRLV